jgi:hypothetical protein
MGFLYTLEAHGDLGGKGARPVRGLTLRGKSQLRNEAHAFLHDMIAIETLLAKRGDRFPEVIADRLIAFFGWVSHRSPAYWEKVVDRLYKLRCAYVHDAQSDQITASDLLHADTIVRNLLRNIGRNPRVFNSKDALIEFQNQIAARTLGMR